MFISKQDKLRHRILKKLVELHESVKGYVVKAEDTAITTEGLAKLLNVSVDDIHRAGAVMVKSDEIMYDVSTDGEIIFAWNNAAIAYYDNKYIEQSRERNRKSIAFYLSIFAILISVSNYINSCNVKANNSTEIKGLQRQLNELKGK